MEYFDGTHCIRITIDAAQANPKGQPLGSYEPLEEDPEILEEVLTSALAYLSKGQA